MRTVAVALLALLAGCVGPDAPPAAPSGEPSDSPAGDEGGLCPPDCFEGREFRLLVAVNATGPFRLDVPLPHGSWCLAPSEWLAGQREAVGLSASLDEAADGRTGTVLRLEGSGAARWTGAVDVAGRAACQTFRYDPWSVDPDPKEGGVDVRADGTLRASVDVVDVEGPCWTVTQHVGDVSAAWTRLPSTGTGTACA